MHFNFGTVLIATAFAASLYLLLNNSERMFPTIAVIVSGIQLLLVMGVMSLSLAKYRIDVILPGVLLVCGAFCWSKSQAKGATTGGTIVTLIAAIQLLLALRLF